MSTDSHLTDADPSAWRSENRPDMSAERQRYDAATLKRDGIGKRIREWHGARSGHEYERLIALWIDATTQADQAYDVMIAAATATGDQPQ